MIEAEQVKHWNTRGNIPPLYKPDYVIAYIIKLQKEHQLLCQAAELLTSGDIMDINPESEWHDKRQKWLQAMSETEVQP